MDHLERYILLIKKQIRFDILCSYLNLMNRAGNQLLSKVHKNLKIPRILFYIMYRYSYWFGIVGMMYQHKEYICWNPAYIQERINHILNNQMNIKHKMGPDKSHKLKKISQILQRMNCRLLDHFNSLNILVFSKVYMM